VMESEGREEMDVEQDGRALKRTKLLDEVFPPPERVSKNAHVRTFHDYKELYEKSLSDPEGKKVCFSR